MINFCLDDKEKNILKSLIGKKLTYTKHDPFDRFGGAMVYGRVELFFGDLVVLIDYDYSPYHLFGSEDDDHPKFAVKEISDDEAVSALQGVRQIRVNCDEQISGITLVEDYAKVEWDGKRDDVRTLIAIIIKFANRELTIQGDYMIPLLNLLKGENTKKQLPKPGEEFANDSKTKYAAKRFYIDV
jgi:hypothetical protein